jgi:hypothetical protein
MRWSGSPEGKRLLAAIFGNSPFLSNIAVKEWAFLTRVVAEGGDPIFAEIVDATGTAPVFAQTRPEEVAGILAYRGRPKTLGEMNAAITAEVERRHAGGRF